MQDLPLTMPFVFIGLCLAGFYLAHLYGRKTWSFRWSEYIALIILPVCCVLYLALSYDPRILNLFLVSAIAGFFLEYIVGLAYHKTLNKRLWIYKNYDLNGYTSLLSIPFWGIAGVAFWLMGRMIGL